MEFCSIFEEIEQQLGTPENVKTEYEYLIKYLLENYKDKAVNSIKMLEKRSEFYN